MTYYHRPYNAHLNNIPVCPYCNKPVGDNEYDVESSGYFSSHFACTSPSKDGKYAVKCDNTGEIKRGKYVSRKRAQEIADDLNRYNTQYNGSKFSVVEV